MMRRIVADGIKQGKKYHVICEENEPGNIVITFNGQADEDLQTQLYMSIFESVALEPVREYTSESMEGYESALGTIFFDELLGMKTEGMEDGAPEAARF